LNVSSLVREFSERIDLQQQEHFACFAASASSRLLPASFTPTAMHHLRLELNRSSYMNRISPTDVKVAASQWPEVLRSIIRLIMVFM
jgi:hypothetical protein